MALLFRLNVISRRLTSLYCSYTQPFLPQLHRPQRNLFTNVYFAKKKVDEVKTAPKCPDFEQYFTKAKKKGGDANKTTAVDKRDEAQLDKKNSDDQQKPLKQGPIFGNGAKPPPQQQRAIAEKKAPMNLPTTKTKTNFPMEVPKNPDASTDKTNPPQTQQSIDKKSITKPLNEFQQFALTPRTLGSRNMQTEPHPAERKESSVSSQAKSVDASVSSQPKSVDDGKLKEKSHTVVVPSEVHAKKSKRNYIWLAGAAAAIGLALLMKRSSSDEAPVIKIETPPESVTSVTTGSVGPLVVPKKVPYLIIGGGTSSWSAFKAIKEHMPNAKVLVVSNEKHPPYQRPPLSKLWLTGSDLHQVEQIYLEPSDFYSDPMRLLNQSNGGISILTDRTAKYLKIGEKKLVLTDGTEIEYDKCLLATGSKPRNLVIFQRAPLSIRNRISFFRNLNDFQRIKEIVSKSDSIAVIGGGHLASEVSLAVTAYAANTTKTKVYQIFHENGNMGTALPKYLSEWIKKKLTEYGLFVLSNTQVDSVHMENSKLKLRLLTGQIVVVDHVIVALGSQPDIVFAQMSGLKLAKGNCGIAVNEHLEALPHLFVAGDAACLPGHCGKDTEHCYDHAIATGRLAGENMTGQKKSFDHQSAFFATIGPEISLESVGVIDSALKTVGVFANGCHLTSDINNANKGIVFYIRNDCVVGVLLWNIDDKIDVARQIIAERKRLYDLNEVVNRFKIRE